MDVLNNPAFIYEMQNIAREIMFHINRQETTAIVRLYDKLAKISAEFGIPGLRFVNTEDYYGIEFVMGPIVRYEKYK
jgi:hypothetical protein